MSQSLLSRRRVILAKVESTYGTDASPANTDAILVQQAGLALKPLEGDEIQRDLLRQFYGSAGKIKVESYATLEFSVELAGSGTAGTVVPYGGLLRACGLAETIIASAFTATANNGAADTSHISLGPSASAIASFYVGMSVTVPTVGASTRYITAYDATSKIATVSAPFPSLVMPSTSFTVNPCVSYTPVSSGQEAVTLYFNVDGVRHILLGSMGTVSFSLEAKTIPTLKFKFTGMLGTISDQALPAADFSDFQVPLAVSTANTTNFSLHGTSGNFQALSFDLGNTIKYRNLIGSQSVLITNRNSVGAIKMEAQPISSTAQHAGATAHDWFGAVRNKDRGVLGIVHGTASGNTVSIVAPTVELGSPNYSESDGIIMLDMALDLIPSAGNDELKLCFM